MIDYDILKEFGTTNNRIREVMTAAHNTKDYKARESLEKEFQNKIQEGILFNLRNHNVFTSADLAWDGHILNKQIIPLTLYAQGRIDIKQVVKQCKDSGITDEELKKYCEWDEERKEFKDINIAKFVETPVNMIRSYVQRRHAAQVSKYDDQYPFLKYETYDRSYEAQLLADITSQRMEIMANDFGYKHNLKQISRDFLLYPHVVEFAECAWKVEKQYRKNKEGDTESFIVKEGVPFITPHPSRVFWDISSPLASINSDTGCEYIGYWELVKYENIKKNTAFWNREGLDYAGTFSELYTQYNPYFSVYYPDVMEIAGNNEFLNDPSAKNDRESNVGIYNTDEEQKYPMILTSFYKKLIPNKYGFGKYPYPVWVRFILAGERTCVYAEIMPDCPAQYYGYNEKDNRLFNISFAHEIMPWQDAISNLMTQLMLSMKHSLLKIVTVNIGRMGPSAVDYLRRVMNGDVYAIKPIVLEHDDDKDSAMGVSDKTIQMDQANQINDISAQVRAIIEMGVFSERSLNMSPQEQGQPSPRVTSATEILEMANTINTLYNFISKAIDEGLSAKKRYLYKATTSLQEGEIHLSVMGQYPDHIIKKAGFSVESSSLEDGRVIDQKVRGEAKRLIYNYVFSSREGSTRTPQVKVAEVLVQLLPQVLQVPEIRESLGVEKIYELFSAILRNAGAGIELKMSALDQTNRAKQESTLKADNDTMMAALDSILKVLGEIDGKLQGHEERIEELQGVAEELLGGAERREEGQRFSGGPIEPVPTQGTPASVPLDALDELSPTGPQDPFDPTIPINIQ